MGFSHERPQPPVSSKFGGIDMSEHRLFLIADERAAIRAGRKTQFRRAVKLKPWQGIELRDDGQP